MDSDKRWTAEEPGGAPKFAGLCSIKVLRLLDLTLHEQILQRMKFIFAITSRGRAGLQVTNIYAARWQRLMGVNYLPTDPIVRRSGIELTTIVSQIRLPNDYTKTYKLPGLRYSGER